jgi:T-complex protein 1 subunit beta
LNHHNSPQKLTLSNGRTRPTCSKNPAQFREDLLAIARTTLSSKVLAADKDYFAELAVSAVLRLKGSTDLDHIQIIKKQGGKLTDSYLDEGFILDKKIGVNCPHRMENAKIMIANTRESGGVFSSQLFGGCI